MSLASQNRVDILHDRAQMLSMARRFFEERGLLEVDCPFLTPAASVDTHIELFAVPTGKDHIRYLHSSPEYAMKRLLAEGIGEIYFLGHVFRNEEWGERHNPEFTLAEWYRLKGSLETLIVETMDFIDLFLGKQPVHTLTYREAFLRFAAIDPHIASIENLSRLLLTHDLPSTHEDRDTYLHLILATIVEPGLASLGRCVLKDYPASQAALAQVQREGNTLVAKRFEVYVDGVELANGYHELLDAQEQRSRLTQANRERQAKGKETLPIDEAFLQALEKGLPHCWGVAVGIDRLMMLRHRTSTIADILPFAWKQL